MKKTMLFTGLILLTTSFGITQGSDETDNRESFRFGLKAGMNNSNVYDAQGESFRADSKFGLALGAFVAIPLGKYFGLQPEILFSQKGFKGNGVLLGSPYEFKRTTSYIDVPLQFTIKPSEFITVLAGPQFSYLIKQRDEFTSSLTSFAQEEEFENDNIRKNIFGFVAGVDINLRHVVLSGRAGWDLSRNNGDGSNSNLRYKNRWVQVTVGYTF